MSTNDARVLITGATGFIGRALTKYLLDSSCHVLAITRKAPIESGAVQWLEADLSSPLSYRDGVAEFAPQVVIHLAWQGIPDYSFDTSLANLNQSLSLLSYVTGLESCKKVLVSGSCWEYANARGMCPESDISQAQNDFTWAKHAVRAWLEAYCGKNNVSYAWFRIFYVYGPGQRPGALLPSILSGLKQGQLPDIRTPCDANDYIYIDDVVEAFRLAVHHPFKSGIYNLGSGESTQVLDVCRIAEHVVFGSTRLTEGLDENAPEKEASIDFWAGLENVKTNLGWLPKTSMADGISQTWNHVKAL